MIYKTLKNNIEQSLDNDKYLNLLVSNNSTMEIANFLRHHEMFLIHDKNNEFYKEIKSKKYEFVLTNNKTKETYIDKINFEEFFNKYVIENKEINKDLEIN